MTSGEEYEESELAAPGPKPRGRKRRTEPILVEREDGTKEEVSPQVYRRLRRRGAASQGYLGLGIAQLCWRWLLSACGVGVLVTWRAGRKA